MCSLGFAGCVLKEPFLSTILCWARSYSAVLTFNFSWLPPLRFVLFSAGGLICVASVKSYVLSFYFSISEADTFWVSNSGIWRLGRLCLPLVREVKSFSESILALAPLYSFVTVGTKGKYENWDACYNLAELHCILCVSFVDQATCRRLLIAADTS